jgi:hypothetical protein
MRQKLEYIHIDPVKRGYVDLPDRVTEVVTVLRLMRVLSRIAEPARRWASADQCWTDRPSMARHHVIDYETFLPRPVAGLRQAWQRARLQRSDKAFYTFGIETDSDITDLNPLCNSQEEYEAQGGGSKPSMDKGFGCLSDDSQLCRIGKEHTEALAKEVNRMFSKTTAKIRRAPSANQRNAC